MENFDVDKLLFGIFSEQASFDVKSAFDQKLLEYGITKTRALKLLKIDKDVFEQVINGSAKQPNLIHVVKIAEFLDVDINKLITIVLKNQNEENIASIEGARKTTFLLKHFEVKTLASHGFFDTIDDTDILVRRVLAFFGYESIQEYEKQLDEPLYSRTKKNHSEKMKDFWVKSAYQTFRIISNPNAYNRERLKDLIIKIKPYSQDLDNGLFTVCKALYNIGVTVIFQDYLPTTQVRGATFIIKDKPCVVITDYRKSYPTLWFTLLHELYHVLFDFDTVSANSFHLTGDNDLFLIEEKADAFAREFFLSVEKFHFIKRYIGNAFMVNKFATENEIHRSIVYSFHAWYQENLYGKNYHGLGKEFYPNYQVAVGKLSPISWNDTSIKAASEKIKSILEIN